MGLHRAAVGIEGAIEHRPSRRCGRRRHPRRRRILRCNQATNVE